MTLPPHKLGDKGQRYELRCEGYPEDGENVIGWFNTRKWAADAARSIDLAPTAKRTWIVDRHRRRQALKELAAMGQECDTKPAKEGRG